MDLYKTSKFIVSILIRLLTYLLRKVMTVIKLCKTSEWYGVGV